VPFGPGVVISANIRFDSNLPLNSARMNVVSSSTVEITAPEVQAQLME
jgi:hypothetical protein